MRVAVTGAAGFVGRWLGRELEAAGHAVVPAPASRALDVTDGAAVRTWLTDARPDAVVHLAAVSFGPDATADPGRAWAVNVGGTSAVLQAVAAGSARIPVLVAGSAEVYGLPAPHDLPLRESAPLAPAGVYGLTKLAQESVARAIAESQGIPLGIVRAFNHTGPGQRPGFVAPALAARLLAIRGGAADRVPVGNLDVRRDIGDVRDVVAAYRLLIEGLAGGTLERGTWNVCTGTSVAIRTLVEELADIIGVEPRLEVDPALVRAIDAPEIRGDASRLRAATGWQPRIELRRTLADLVADLEADLEARAAREAGTAAVTRPPS